MQVAAESVIELFKDELSVKKKEVASHPRTGVVIMLGALKTVQSNSLHYQS